MRISFKKWLSENSAAPGGLEPPKQDPTQVGSMAFADFHGKEAGVNPKNPEGQLPPVPTKRKMKKGMKKASCKK